MANPSLQIGNGKFAIKENDLLGYSSSGTRFFPIPITMTRATLGSRVNPSGLIEDVALLGSEEVTGFTNGTTYPFTTFTTLGNNITSAIVSSAFAGAVSNAISVTSGEIYKVTFDYTKNSGNDLRVVFSSSVNGAGTQISDNQLISASGTYTKYFTITSTTTGYLQMGTGNSGHSLNASISNISVKEATIDGLARVDYTDGTGSLLVERQRTNLVTYSEIYGSGYYFSGTLQSVIDNTTSTSPTGIANATQIRSTGSGKLQSGTKVLTQNTDYVLTFYAKNVDATEVQSRVLDLSGGSGGSNLTSVSYISEINTTEWKRITHSFNTGTGTNFILYLSNSLNNGGSIQLWGAQLEEASYATSYIKTQGSTVTRNQDRYSKTGISDKINSEEGVLFVEMAALVEVDSSRRHITLNDGGASNKVVIRYESTGVITARYDIGGSAQASIAFATTITNSHKIAFKYKVNDFALWVDGTEVGTDTPGSVLSAETINKLSFDSGNGTFPFFGKVKQLQIFKTALSDPELATLTT